MVERTQPVFVEHRAIKGEHSFLQDFPLLQDLIGQENQHSPTNFCPAGYVGDRDLEAGRILFDKLDEGNRVTLTGTKDLKFGNVKSSDSGAPDLSVFDNTSRITKAFNQAVREALLEHKRIGNSVAVWRDGKVVIVPPEEIEAGS